MLDTSDTQVSEGSLRLSQIKTHDEGDEIVVENEEVTEFCNNLADYEIANYKPEYNLFMIVVNDKDLPTIGPDENGIVMML